MGLNDSYLVFFYPKTQHEDGDSHAFAIITQLEFDLVSSQCKDNYSIHDLHLNKLNPKDCSNPVIDIEEPVLIDKKDNIYCAIDAMKKYENVMGSYLLQQAKDKISNMNIEW